MPGLREIPNVIFAGNGLTELIENKMAELEEVKVKWIERLCGKFPWLREKTESLFHLFEECRSFGEVELVAELLDRFNMIDDEKRYEGYKGMAKYIASHFEDGKTLIIAMTKGTDPDSGQRVLADIRIPLMNEGIRKIDYKNVFNLSKKEQKFEKIVIVDEFLGSGKTVRGRLRDINQNLKNVKEVYFCLLAGMSSSVSDLRTEFALQDKHVEMYCHYQFKRGIWGYHNGDALVDKTMLMLGMERRLSPKVGSRNLHEFCFGYGNAQSLVAFGKYSNIPNSVFPIFWWPNHDFLRPRLFERDESGFNEES